MDRSGLLVRVGSVKVTPSGFRVDDPVRRRRGARRSRRRRLQAMTTVLVPDCGVQPGRGGVQWSSDYISRLMRSPWARDTQMHMLLFASFSTTPRGSASDAPLYRHGHSQRLKSRFRWLILKCRPRAKTNRTRVQFCESRPFSGSKNSINPDFGSAVGPCLAHLVHEVLERRGLLGVA